MLQKAFYIRTIDLFEKSFFFRRNKHTIISNYGDNINLSVKIIRHIPQNICRHILPNGSNYSEIYLWRWRNYDMILACVCDTIYRAFDAKIPQKPEALHSVSYNLLDKAAFFLPNHMTSYRISGQKKQKQIHFIQLITFVDILNIFGRNKT